MSATIIHLNSILPLLRRTQYWVQNYSHESLASCTRWAARDFGFGGPTLLLHFARAAQTESLSDLNLIRGELAEAICASAIEAELDRRVEFGIREGRVF